MLPVAHLLPQAPGSPMARRQAAMVHSISALGVGLLIGGVLGYAFMGTAHTVLQIGAGPQRAAGDVSATTAADRQLRVMGGERELVLPGTLSAEPSIQIRQLVLPGALSTKPTPQAHLLQPTKAAEQATTVAKGQGLSPLQAATVDELPWPRTGRTIHTVCTSNGSPYLNFQTRIMYGTYKKAQQLPGGERLAAFTRILHRQTPDILMDEVPTWRADPLTPKCDDWCEFPVADRPNAVRQWLDAAVLDPSVIKAPWILMIETDYVWMRPPQPPRAEDSSQASWAFPFGYITPQEAHLQAVVRRMYPKSAGPVTDISGSGPAPVMMRAHEWAKVTPDWERLAAHIEADLETKELLGWVREMYGFSIATALQGIKLDLQLPPDSQLIAQPPADDGLGKAAMFHYTWGSIFKDGLGEDSPEVWRFDKRDYTDKALEEKVPLVPELPEFKVGWVLQDGNPVRPDLYNVLKQMVVQMNLAIKDLPDLSPTQT